MSITKLGLPVKAATFCYE